MNEVKLNLARKWRSKQFSEIIGQELPVRMLKNSLYRDHYFPVYLFSGQRGCGKTTTARVFAAAVNCEQLAEFQKNPKSCTLPCLQCTSCLAMTAGKHPDFIEIDAASHTGVDNVRAIIESSSLMPLMGSKKIYLIDEAHMLSKAAFNALLKIMEEPPASVLFILATTDAQKILETVKSRCFQLFFDPVQADYLLTHLIAVCQKENIRFDKEGLELIIKQTEGSVRDALNMIEQVRFASSMVSKDGVLSVLGHLDDERLIALAQLVITCKPKQLLLFLQQNRIVDYRAEYIWNRIMLLIHALLWLKYGVRPDDFNAYHDELQQLARATTIARLHAMLSLFSQNELLFSRTTAQHSYLEMILLQLCFDASKPNNDGGSSPLTQQQAASAVTNEGDYLVDEDDEVDDDEDESNEEDDEDIQEETVELGYQLAWKTFIRDLAQLDDPLVSSVFQQGTCTSYVPQDFGTNGMGGILTVSFAKDLSFFEDTVMGAQRAWLPILQSAFKAEVKLVALFDQAKSVDAVRSDYVNPGHQTRLTSPDKPDTAPVRHPVLRSLSGGGSLGGGGKDNSNGLNNRNTNWRPANANNQFQKKSFSQPQPRGSLINVSDKDVWVKANLLLSHFPGTVYELPQQHKIESIQLESMQ